MTDIFRASGVVAEVLIYSQGNFRASCVYSEVLIGVTTSDGDAACVGVEVSSQLGMFAPSGLASINLSGTQAIANIGALQATGRTPPTYLSGPFYIMSTLADRVKEHTLSTGTGAIALDGIAPTGFRSFATAFGIGSTLVNYCIDDLSGNWEVGAGQFNGTTELTRTTVLSSSNSNGLVAFAEGEKTVFCTAPAALLGTGDDYRVSNFVAGTDYLAPSGSAAGLSGLPTLTSLGAQASGTYATGTGTANGTNTGDQVLPTTLPASDVSVWAKEATKPNYTKSEVGLGDVPNLSFSGSNTGDNAPNTSAAGLSNNTFTGAQVGSVTTLSVSANAVAINLTSANDFSLALQATTSQVLSNPIAASAGTAGQIVITQNGTPSALTYGSSWIPFDGTAPTVSTTANTQNLLSFYVADSTHIWFSLSKGGVA